MGTSSERFRRAASDLTKAIDGVPADAWSNPSPCEGWTARDVVRHLVEWIPGPGFLLGAFGIETGPVPSVDEDPAGAWRAVRDAIQRGLDDSTTAEKVADCGPPGEMSFAAAVDMTCTPDVLIHTWDLAQAADIDVSIDLAQIEHLATQYDAMPPEADAAMRGSGHFGPRIEVAADADALTRVLGFMGRDTNAAL